MASSAALGPAAESAAFVAERVCPHAATNRRTGILSVRRARNTCPPRNTCPHRAPIVPLLPGHSVGCGCQRVIRWGVSGGLGLPPSGWGDCRRPGWTASDVAHYGAIAMPQGCGCLLAAVRVGYGTWISLRLARYSLRRSVWAWRELKRFCRVCCASRGDRLAHAPWNIQRLETPDYETHTLGLAAPTA
jgi:hypothetical protein